MSGVIYQITCKTTNMAYIGQATELKYKKGIPYHYGAKGRWSDHVCASRTRQTPFAQAIRTYTPKDFTITILETLPLEDLDERETTWMTHLNTIHPHGYNVAKHSRNRHREESNLSVFYEDKVDRAILSSIKEHGELRFVYVYLEMKNGQKERLTFGQKKGNTYKDSMDEAVAFLDQVGCPYVQSQEHSDDLSERYSSKVNEFKGKEITSIRITSASRLIAVYVGTSNMKLSKEHKRICFGGKTISKDEAYGIALQFVAQLHVSDKIIHDSIKSLQQVTA